MESDVRSSSRKYALLVVLLVSIFLFACNFLVPVASPVATALPSAPPLPSVTDTPAPSLSQQVTVVSVAAKEEDAGNGYPPYTITSQTPQLSGSDDPRVLAFNQRINELVVNEENAWRQEFQGLPITPLSHGSSLDVTYALVGQFGDVWSFKFDFSFYADTAAHPGLNTITLNYDLANGRELALKDLFLPNSEFLEEVAHYSMVELGKLPYADIISYDGAQPVAENYRNWNITSQGLMITFIEYQVASYAAGPQTVIVPYSALATIIDPNGPLARFMP